MKLLERQPDAVRDAPPEPPVEAPPEHAPPEPELRTCKSCGATMEPGQDWCLACGTAAGRLGGRPRVPSLSAAPRPSGPTPPPTGPAACPAPRAGPTNPPAAD